MSVVASCASDATITAVAKGGNASIVVMGGSQSSPLTGQLILLLPRAAVVVTPLIDARGLDPERHLRANITPDIGGRDVPDEFIHNSDLVCRSVSG